MSFFLRKLKAFVLWWFRIIRRAFCCFRLRSGPAQTEETSECLTHIGVVPNKSFQQEKWTDEWDEEKSQPQSVEEHIQLYREKLTAPVSHDPSKELLDNMFQELEPQEIKQKRVVIATQNAVIPEPKENVDLSRLSAVNNFSSELGEWMEESSSGWDEQQLDPSDFIRQQKRSHNRNKLHTTKLAA